VTTAEFAHLHLHTEFSLLDGIGRVDEYVRQAQQLNLRHLAVTDHGVMYAAMHWYKAATDAGLHPIIGMEAYLADGSAKARERKSYHLLLLAENVTGYRNLLKLATLASLEGFYYRPRVDMEMLAEYHEGIIATSACLSGPVATNMLQERPEIARKYAGDLATIFGPEHFYIELQDHGLLEQKRVNPRLTALARDLELPIIATNDVHYCNQEDAPAQEILVCVQTNSTLSDPKRLKMESDQFYLKSPDEMFRLFGELPESLSNTIKIAEMCDLKLDFSGYHVPHFDVPDGQTGDSYLESLCRQGLVERYGHCGGAVAERLNHELGVIREMEFTDYFLVVWDFVRFARENGILVGPGRGSAAASIVTYGLGITALDPLEHDLIFERFLNPARITMPDIDIDFADDRRGDVIDYVIKKYGNDHVAQIVTFGRMAAKQSVRDVGRAMGVPVRETDRVAKLIPAGPGITIDSALKKVPELRSIYDLENGVHELLDNARKVEGIARHASTHAAGVVISREPLVRHVPLQRAGGKSEGDITTQYPMDQLEALGLLKMDFLGLRTLTVLGKAVALLRDAGHDISLETIPLDDERSYELLRAGQTVGVFQLEGGMTTRMTVDVAPSSFADLTALMALIRPGPMVMAPDYIARKHGRTPIEFMHPELEPILQETYGVALYQEQIMRVANTLAGFSMTEGDGLRYVMGKKLPLKMASYRERFIQGCQDHGLPQKLAAEIWSMVERFAGYGFNKAHSAAYAVIAAQTAYLKANHPVEFMAALLSSEIGNTDKIVFNVVECRRAGIDVLAPDVNTSARDFTVAAGVNEQTAIRFGLAAVKNVGAGAVEAILTARAKQPLAQFTDLHSFCAAIDWESVSRRAVESLARCGALDCFGPRSDVLGSLDASIGGAQQHQKAVAKGQIGLFATNLVRTANETRAPLVPGPELDAAVMLGWERELTGLYLSAHPLTGVLKSGAAGGVTQVVELPDRPLGERVVLVGIVKSIRRVATRNNRSMAIIEFEDLSGSIEVVVFPEVLDRFTEFWTVDAILRISAKVDRRGEALQLICERATDQLALEARPMPPMRLHVELPRTGDVWADIQLMNSVDEILRRNEGEYELVIHLPVGHGETPLLSRTRRVDWSDSLAADLGQLLGGERTRVEVPRN